MQKYKCDVKIYCNKYKCLLNDQSEIMFKLPVNFFFLIYIFSSYMSFTCKRFATIRDEVRSKTL